jgi:hypothetical protein
MNESESEFWIEKKKRVIPVIHRTVGSKDRRVRWDADRMGRGPRIAQITLIIFIKLN